MSEHGKTATGQSVTLGEVKLNAAATIDRGRKNHRRSLTIAVLIVLTIVAASCGRSAPIDGVVAAPTSTIQPDEAAEAPAVTTETPSTDQMAGVRVTSDAQLVTATTAPTVPPNTSTATTTAPASAGEATTYEVQPGDTLSVIAEQFGIPLSALSEANGIGDVDSISPGQELVIPAAS